MIVIRILLGALLGLLALVLILPGVILIDLVSGGTGLGLCQNGLGSCSTGVYAGAELLVLAGGALLVLGGLIALCVKLLRKLGGSKSSFGF